MKKFLLAPALAALAMFLFGAAYWMSPLPYKALTPVGDNAAAAHALAQLFPSTGTYLIPGPEIADQKLLTELYERGPSVQVQFVKEGHPVMQPGVFLRGYLHYFVVALLLAILLENVRAAFAGYGSIVKITTLVGLAGAILICFSDPIWWHHPWGWHVAMALYAALEFLVAGLVLGRFFRPVPAVEPGV